jgi:hypothetical protein
VPPVTKLCLLSSLELLVALESLLGKSRQSDESPAMMGLRGATPYI